MNYDNLNTYYNKFYEEKRLKTRHGIVEFTTTMNYIHEYLNQYDNPSILDVGAGSGAYSKVLMDEGYNVQAVELIKHNVKMIEAKGIPVIEANATDLSKLKDQKYDIILLFGPLYHLETIELQTTAINEAKKHLKDDGIIMISYIMNDYAVISHGFMEKAITDEINNNRINDKFIITPKEDDLYNYVTIDTINELNKRTNMKRIKIIAQDGPANYIREYVNKLTDTEFDLFIKYHLLNCERSDLLGASAHLLDIIKKDE